MRSEPNNVNARSPKQGAVLGARIDALSWDETLTQIVDAAAQRASRYVCICNVHSVVTASLNPAFMDILNQADLATPDGAPIAWSLRRMGFIGQPRINGPDLMWRYLEQAQRLGQIVYFYGSTDSTLARLRRRLLRDFPRLQIGGMHAPPFRRLNDAEDAREVAMINRSGAHVVLVGLGCPKQEQWMAAHRGRIASVMIGVGAAFDYHAGVLRRAPRWCQELGLEWLYRMATEPRRLLRRYAVTNTLFILGIARQFVRRRRQLRHS